MCNFVTLPLFLQWGETALHWACKYGHVELAGLLLSKRADIQAKSDVSLNTVRSLHTFTDHITLTLSFFSMALRLFIMPVVKVMLN